MQVRAALKEEMERAAGSRRLAAAALSGGVDSAVAAKLMLQGGWRVMGLFLRLHESAGQAEESARAVAESLDIPFSIIDAREKFQACVVTPFIDDYNRGLTPNPCVTCNETVKFAILHGAARDAGCSIVVTGHYARTEFGPAAGRHLLLRAADRSKDQSYCLYRLPQSILARAHFPLGSFAKAETRQMARTFGLPVASRPESQDICFLGDNGYRQFVGGDGRPVQGDIVDTGGRVMGRHNGIHQFTPGQRRGLRLQSSCPLYVIRIDPGTNTVIVGGREEAYFSRVDVSDAVFIHPDPPPLRFEATARHRYRSPETHVAVSTVRREEDGTYLLEAEFSTPQFAPAPGQSLVLYDGDLVIGGGVISAVH